MSQFNKLNEQISVSPQISRADIDEASANGVTLIINNRPDGEEAGQPTNDTLAAYASDKGIKWVHIPIVPGQLTMDDIANTSNALKDHKNILAFCRSGTRSCNLWGLAQALTGAAETSDILASARSAGYDLAGIVGTLDQLNNEAR